ncbi:MULTISPECIES: zinc ribbon domain-containing protein [unclassified Thomasclavelia]|uniref:Zinc ribbon domain-containing protein n=1 Tax=Candidatus Erysipelatoclostridium merdavium TaxID=2838566 RepID=A0A9D2BNW2_9FIRM|nr:MULTISPECIES: zinc ribbon domain-containing protein [unclassified Thomasclavelia]OUP76754.1 hypothetical protein B5F09_07870 [Erysipelatoclostridium sp. An173]HIX82377.1 zinc ribbon domain-containing protein [Candidatus Erysipelatoclostridium merdavium]
MYEDDKVLDELYRELGKAYYEGAFEDPLPQLLPLFDQITEHLNQKNVVEEQEPVVEEVEKPEEPVETKEENNNTGLKCPVCGAAITDKQAFCISCGTNLKELATAKEEPAIKVEEKVSESCPYCGAPINPNQKFCIQCGKSLEKPVERFSFDDPKPVQDPIEPDPVTPTCPNCGATVKIGQKFCTKCGSSIPQNNNNQNVPPVMPAQCPKCGKPLDPNDRFCTSCGTKIR